MILLFVSSFSDLSVTIGDLPSAAAVAHAPVAPGGSGETRPPVQAAAVVCRSASDAGAHTRRGTGRPRAARWSAPSTSDAEHLV